MQQSLYFPPEFGGLESYVLDLCRGLVREGHRVTMLTSRSIPGTPRRETVEGVRVVRTWFGGKHALGWGAHVAWSAPTHGRLARGADILHAQTFATAPPAIASRRRFGLPLVLTLHTSHFQRLQRKPHWRPYLRWIVSSADWVFTASSQLREMVLDLVERPRVEALTNAADTEVFRPVSPALPPPPDGVRRLVAPVRLFPPKGVRHLVDAVPLLLERTPVEVVVLGDGPDRDSLEEQARSNGAAGAMRFLGRQPRDAMPGLLCSADLVVLPSLMEATSIAALEAMACGVPVAASDVGGLPELIDDEVGTLFRVADPADLAARVAKLLEREDLREMGRAARARVVERWSLERLVRRHEEVYRLLLEESGGDRG
ncbi:MAG TPA: glycosyltransferase family 4 protein [Longimicrobiales bacterium]|nr:glycosyltransferase family 4 protein [Longimicrobiales bacterium]